MAAARTAVAAALGATFDILTACVPVQVARSSQMQRTSECFRQTLVTLLPLYPAPALRSRLGAEKGGEKSGLKNSRHDKTNNEATDTKLTPAQTRSVRRGAIHAKNATKAPPGHRY
jgi:hypothetical protein